METAEQREVEAEPGAPDEEDAAQEETPLESVAEVAEQLGHSASTLALREAQLRAAHHTSDVQLAAKALAVGLVGAVALIAAFALANWAAVAALSSPLPGWRAPLVLAAAWAVIGVGLLALLHMRARKAGLDVTRILRADQAELVQRRELARDEAVHEVRESFDRLTDTVSSQAGALVAAAVGPIVGGAVSAGEAIIEQIDEITDDIEEAVPGGSVINRATDLALIPGRYFVKVVRMAVKVSPG